MDIHSKKILFAPHEIGGQMQLMVETLRRRGYYATAASYTQEWFGHINDISFNLENIKGSLRKHSRIFPFTLWAVQNFDIFHFFWGESLYGIRLLPLIDLPLLRRMGKKIFVHFRGLDLIDLKYFDYLRQKTSGATVEEPPISRPNQLKSLNIWRKYSNKIFVSEPDLLRVVPEAILVQQAIDLNYWKSERFQPKSKEDGIIRIAHAPSLRRKKGTEFVEQSIAELKELGYMVELVLIEKVPFTQVKQLYEECDFGVDQVLYGWYGKVSIELMALGRPVICYINPEWQPYRSDMPIVNSHPGQLTQILRQLIDDKQRRKFLGEAGQAYVSRHHDVEHIVDQCVELYSQA